jgi:hypothetical protein
VTNRPHVHVRLLSLKFSFGHDDYLFSLAVEYVRPTLAL